LQLGLCAGIFTLFTPPAAKIETIALCEQSISIVDQVLRATKKAVNRIRQIPNLSDAFLDTSAEKTSVNQESSQAVADY
jgi:hypothetical protein